MKKSYKGIFLFFVLMMILTLLGGCGSPDEKTDAGSGDVNEPKAAVVSKPEPDANLDKDIVIVQALDMISFDPINTSDLSNGYVINSIYSKLFDFDEDLNAEPELVENYELISDTEWQFQIYKGIKTHDGQELTADDVVYSLQRTQQGTAIGALFKSVDKISKVDDYTINITTKGPYPALPTALTHQACCIVPKHYCEQTASADNWTKPVGTGRYVLKNRVIGDSIVGERFDDYFNQDDKACNKSLTFKIIPEGSGRTIAVETGEADLNIVFDTVDYERVLSNSNVQLWDHYSQTVWHLVYNNATFAPTCLGAVENPKDKYSYDPEKAKELMAEAGCPGFETEIIVFRDEAERIAVVVQAYLKEIGIDAKVTRIENSVFASYIVDHRAPMFITSWGSYWDPDLFLSRRFSSEGIGGVNRTWYLNPELDTMIEKGRSSFDNDVRAEIYGEAQEFMAEEAPECDLYVNTMYALANKDLKGVEINVEMPYHFHKLHY